MRIITDWHVHSAYSRACSKDLTLENNAFWCAKKGVNVLGTGDFTHPKWFAELNNKLEPAEQGMFRLRDVNHPRPLLKKEGGEREMRYMLTAEVSQIYKRGDKTRRIHNIVMAPSLESVEKINNWLTENGFNVKADGRPILGIDSEELYKRLKDIDDRVVMIPAHAWTPWFAVFGSKTGFDTLEECFGSMTPFVYAIETGLSSDPLMNRSLSALDSVSLISNSDAHSPRNFGREANVFELESEDVTYDSFIDILKTRDLNKFKYTIEFHPEEGKYHVDGHMACGFACEPSETLKLKGLCPVCRRPLTVGVLSRVSQLADRELTEVPNGLVPFKSIVPLQEIIAESYGVKSTAGKKVQEMYEKMITTLGTEFEILLDLTIKDIEAGSNEVIAEAIRRVRAGEMSIRPGYDGVYGKVKIFDEKNPRPVTKQEKSM